MAAYYTKMSTTVFSFSLEGVDLKDEKEEKKIDNCVEKKIKDIVDRLKGKSEKFIDPDFGPTDDDEYGAKSFYGSSLPAPAGSKYPAPESLLWTRPVYDDDKFSLAAKNKSSDDGESDGNDDEEEEEEDEYGSGGDNDSNVCLTKSLSNIVITVIAVLSI